MKEKGHNYIFWYDVLFKHLTGLKLGGKCRFSNNIQAFVFVKHNCLNNSFNRRLHLLDIFGFWPKFNLFQYAKLPTNKRVKSGQLGDCLLIPLLLLDFTPYKPFHHLKHHISVKLYNLWGFKRLSHTLENYLAFNASWDQPTISAFKWHLGKYQNLAIHISFNI